ncbi:glycoside hydrolase family 31 protein [Viridothelium virens]|uniref:alpha-glucosidase n=1 Tax=Viridothelium virens TaxID=1048519 RepID=A0A6A6GW73_VIRVR|nr:glycoside hydrolase family 31 protein [Viridothelium virens]
MVQYEYVPCGFVLDNTPDRVAHPCLFLHNDHAGAVSDDAAGLTFTPTSPFKFSFEVLRPNLFRTTFTSEKHQLPPHRSTPVPEPYLGGVEISENHQATQKAFDIGDLKVSVEWSKAPVVSISYQNSDGTLFEDLPFRSYVIDGPGVSHYTRFKKNTLHVGLGEKSAPMNLQNRGFELSATDSFGYDVYRTDPLYKHIPLLINALPHGCVASFSTSHCRGRYAIGSEMDGLWGYYKVYRQDHGGLEEYTIVGKTIKEVVKTFADLVGYPQLVPRWAFGYLGGGMKYSMLDDPPAADALVQWAQKVKNHDIPCSGFQLSSGYTVAETEPKTRNVFTWNRHRFPDPEGWIKAFHERGIRIIANVKPYVLANHPAYRMLKDAGALFHDPICQKSAEMRLWSAGGGESGEGSHLDFTSSAGFRWWYEGVRQLKKEGIDCIWNDNNEYTIPSDDWQIRLDEPSVQREESPCELSNQVGWWGRALHTELMGKSSYEACIEVNPHERPFVLTRSATIGTMRYACSSWSGDNITSWEGMKGANALSLTAGMCLLQCYGHDIGGFEGPQPSPELLLRWVQLGTYSPRFAINCYKTSPADNTVGDVIEPWMYPEVLPQVRDAIKMRYSMIPYLYSLHLESHLFAIPPQRWVGWGYESDKMVWESRKLLDGEEQYWLGDALLIGGVYESGVTTAKLYLPKRAGQTEGYWNLNEPWDYLEPGQWVEVKSEWRKSIPVLAKAGTAIPGGKSEQTVAPGDSKNEANLPEDNLRYLRLFPPRGSSSGKIFANTWYEDDGISLKPEISKFHLTMSCTDLEIRITFEPDSANRFKPPWLQGEIPIYLPQNESRKVVSDKNVVQQNSVTGTWVIQ